VATAIRQPIPALFLKEHHEIHSALGDDGDPHPGRVATWSRFRFSLRLGVSEPEYGMTIFAGEPECR
jgi:hypothetical protein